MLQKLWYDRPVRTQLLIAIGAINLIAALLAGVISIINTRSATRVEIEASLEIAQRFVTATMKDLAKTAWSSSRRSCRSSSSISVTFASCSWIRWVSSPSYRPSPAA